MGGMVRAMGQYLLIIATPSLNYCLGNQALLGSSNQMRACSVFRATGNQYETMEGRSIPLGDAYVDFTEHEPISRPDYSLNYPVEMAARSIAPVSGYG